MSLSRRSSVVARLAVAFLGALSGCDEGDAGVEPALAFSTEPSVVRTVVGAEVAVVLRLADAGREGSVRWVTGRPDLVRLDTVVAVGSPARLRALAAGQTAVFGTVSSRGQLVMVSVPVEVAGPLAGAVKE